MNLGIKFGIYTSLTFILIILGLFVSGINLREDFMQIMVGAGTLCLFVGVALSIIINFNRNKTGGISMLVDIKTGLASSAIFAILISLFLVLYFTSIDSEFAERRRDQIIEQMQEPEAVAELQKQMEADPDAFKGKSVDDMIERNVDNVEHMLSPGTVFPIALFSLLLLGMVYSFLVTAFNRLILAKLK